MKTWTNPDINEELLRQIEEEFDEQKKKVEEARDLFRRRKQQEIEKKLHLLQHQLVQGENVVQSREERQEIQNKIKLTLKPDHYLANLSSSQIQ